jgi:hypothetical protein
MMTVSRRGLLSGAAGLFLFSRNAGASVARALSLGELVASSRHVLIGTSVDAFSNWETIGKRRCIVTYSLFRVEEPLDGRAPATSELTIRTLGGVVGDIGQTFHGEAVVALNERATVFIHDTKPDVFVVTAMAQGHYPLRADARGVARLHANFDAVVIDDAPEAAMRRLDGRSTPEAAGLISKEYQRVSR